MEETFILIFLYILQYISEQSLENQLAIASFQPDFRLVRQDENKFRVYVD